MVLGIVLRRGVLLMWIKIGHGPTVLAVGVGWGYWVGVGYFPLVHNLKRGAWLTLWTQSSLFHSLKKKQSIALPELQNHPSSVIRVKS